MMKKGSVIAVFLFLGFLANSQTGNAQANPNLAKQRTFRVSKYYQELVHKLHLQNVRGKKFEEWFRLVMDHQVVQICRKKNGSFVGTVTNYAEKESSSSLNVKKSPKTKMISNTADLGFSECELAFELFRKYSTILEIRYSNRDSLGNFGLPVTDGEFYWLEASNPPEHLIMQVGTFRSGPRKIETDLIVQFIEELDEALKLEKSKSEFFGTLPNGVYLTQGFEQIVISRKKK